MFKGLKSKLEDEAKRLQATVSQYGENLATQVRSNAVGPKFEHFQCILVIYFRAMPGVISVEGGGSFWRMP